MICILRGSRKSDMLPLMRNRSQTEYRAGIIGCGRIGSEFDKEMPRKIAFSHAGAYFLSSRARIVAACDSNSAKLDIFRKKWEVNRVYLDYREMLSREKIDILSVCTPGETHWPIVQYASEFPISAIYCEKPISNNLEDARKMVRLCRERKILLMVNHQRRFDPFYQELKEKISNGEIGKIQQVNCYYTRGILNTGIHILDLFCYFFNRVEWVMAVHSQNKCLFKKDLNLDGVIKFKSGPLITMKACDDRFYLILELDILTSKVRIRLGDKFEYFQVGRRNNLLKKNVLIKVETPPFRFKYGPISLTLGVEHIINCLEGREKPLSSGQQSINALEVIEAMRSSAKDGKNILSIVKGK